MTAAPVTPRTGTTQHAPPDGARDEGRPRGPERPRGRREPGTPARHLAPHRPSRLARVLGATTLAFALLVLTVGLAAAATHFVEPPLPLPLPARTSAVGAALVTTVLSGLAARRIGGHTVAATVFAAVASGGGVLSGWPWLLAGVAALTAVVATVLAVLATRPAKSPLRVAGEYALAIVVALVGAVAVAAYAVPLRPIVLGHVALLASLFATLWVAQRLGGGVRGLGKRGVFVIVSAVTVIVLGLAYSEALRRWGGPGVTEAIAGVRQILVGVFGAVPRPLELFIGFPALVWGLATRAELRQGWWVCAFGSLGTAGAATSLAATADPGQALLSTLYSALAGLVLGFVVWRVDRLLTGPRGRRARRVQRAVPLREEPSRSRPLL